MKQLTQWLSDDSPFLVLHGIPGSGLVQISQAYPDAKMKTGKRP